jgi:chaperonin GroES
LRIAVPVFHKFAGARGSLQEFTPIGQGFLHRNRTLRPELPAQKKSFSTEEDRTMNARPLQDRVIVKRVQEEDKTKGGIIIPDSAKEKPIEGKIVAVGSGRILESGKKVPLQVKKGDKVLFGKYSGTEIKIDGEELLIMKEDDIVAIIEK